MFRCPRGVVRETSEAWNMGRIRRGTVVVHYHRAVAAPPRSTSGSRAHGVTYRVDNQPPKAIVQVLHADLLPPGRLLYLHRQQRSQKRLTADIIPVALARDLVLIEEHIEPSIQRGVHLKEVVEERLGGPLGDKPHQTIPVAVSQRRIVRRTKVGSTTLATLCVGEGRPVLRLSRVLAAVLATPGLTTTSTIVLRRLIGLVGLISAYGYGRPACGRANQLPHRCKRFRAVLSEGQDRGHPANVRRYLLANRVLDDQQLRAMTRKVPAPQLYVIVSSQLNLFR